MKWRCLFRHCSLAIGQYGVAPGAISMSSRAFHSDPAGCLPACRVASCDSSMSVQLPPYSARNIGNGKFRFQHLGCVDRLHRLFEISDGPSEYGWVVLQPSYACVAWVTQNPSYSPRVVVVVNDRRISRNAPPAKETDHQDFVTNSATPVLRIPQRIVRLAAEAVPAGDAALTRFGPILLVALLTDDAVAVPAVTIQSIARLSIFREVGCSFSLSAPWASLFQYGYLATFIKCREASFARSSQPIAFPAIMVESRERIYALAAATSLGGGRLHKGKL